MQKLKFSLLIILGCCSTGLLGQHTYKLDPGHTLIQFNVERFIVGEVTGAFTTYNGVVTLDDNNSFKNASVTIKVKSLDSNNETRDGHLTGPTWLDAANFPEITFVSTRTFEKGPEQFVQGNLTIKGITKEISFPFEMKGPFKDPTGSVTIGISANLTINRQYYGINFSKTMDNGELFIGNDVVINIRALASLEDEDDE